MARKTGYKNCFSWDDCPTDQKPYGYFDCYTCYYFTGGMTCDMCDCGGNEVEQNHGKSPADVTACQCYREDSRKKRKNKGTK